MGLVRVGEKLERVGRGVMGTHHIHMYICKRTQLTNENTKQRKEDGSVDAITGVMS